MWQVDERIKQFFLEHNNNILYTNKDTNRAIQYVCIMYNTTIAGLVRVGVGYGRYFSFDSTLN